MWQVCVSFAAFAWGHVLWRHNTSSNTLFLQNSPLHHLAGHFFFFFFFTKQQEIALFVLSCSSPCYHTLSAGTLIAAFWGNGCHQSLIWKHSYIFSGGQISHFNLTSFSSHSTGGHFLLTRKKKAGCFRIILSLFLRMREARGKTFSYMFFFLIYYYGNANTAKV